MLGVLKQTDRQGGRVNMFDEALVGAIQGVQYAFLFVLSLTLVRYFPQLKEITTPRQKVGKALAIVAIGFGLYFMTII